MGWQMQRGTVITICMFLFLHSTEADVVSLKMKLDTEASTFLYIRFYNGTFSTFYDCLSSNIWQECRAILASNAPTTNPDSNHDVTSVETLKPTSSHDSPYFKCENDQQHLLCTRQPEDTAVCEGPRPSQASTFQLNDASSDPHTCVGIMWNSPGEGIIFSNSELFDTCDPACAGNSSDNTLNGRRKVQRTGRDTKTETIIAIIITIAVLLCVVVVGFVCWRRSVAAAGKDKDLESKILATSSGSSMKAEHEVVLNKDNSDYSV